MRRFPKSRKQEWKLAIFSADDRGELGVCDKPKERLRRRLHELQILHPLDFQQTVLKIWQNKGKNSQISTKLNLPHDRLF